MSGPPVTWWGEPRLLRGIDAEHPRARFADHERTHGLLPRIHDRAAFHAELEASGLRGRGGAGFPFARKLASLAKRRSPVVVVNASEGEPLSRKDAALLQRVPHLVLDGAQAVADAIDADRVVIYLHRSHPLTLAAVEEALTERRLDRVPMSVVLSPDRYVAWEASAAVALLSGGAALPTMKPPQPTERGVKGHPTVLSNAETFAHVALIARHGGAWFRALGAPTDPGTLLLTVTDGRAHAVVEAPTGAPLDAVVARAGYSLRDTEAVLLGGYAGTWLRPRDWETLPLDRDGLAQVGLALGVGQVALLPAGACHLVESARITRWLAGESAGQCGPCAHGLPALAGALEQIVAGHADAGTITQAGRWAGMVERRGACAHPDGTARLVRSALGLDPEHVGLHIAGGCAARGSAFPIPATAVA